MKSHSGSDAYRAQINKGKWIYRRLVDGRWVDVWQSDSPPTEADLEAIAANESVNKAADKSEPIDEPIPCAKPEPESVRVIMEFDHGNKRKIIVKTKDPESGAQTILGEYLRPKNRDLHGFCAEVADQVESKLGKPITWSMPRTGNVYRDLDWAGARQRLAQGNRAIGRALLSITLFIVACLLLYYGAAFAFGLMVFALCLVFL